MNNVNATMFDREGMRTISWTVLLCQLTLLPVHFGADGTQR